VDGLATSPSLSVPPARATRRVRWGFQTATSCFLMASLLGWNGGRPPGWRPTHRRNRRQRLREPGGLTGASGAREHETCRPESRNRNERSPSGPSLADRPSRGFCYT